LGLTRVQVIRKKRAQIVRCTGRGIQNRELRDGAISTHGGGTPVRELEPIATHRLGLNIGG
jgi:hypothetical protein